MPSTRTLLTGICLSFFALTNARVIPAEACEWDWPGKTEATPTPLLSNGSAELPSTNLTLLYVAIGRGTQNYTCASPSATAVFIGAAATLFDATSLAREDEAALNAVPPMFAYEPCPTTSLRLASWPIPLPILGHHFFNSASTPTFDLSSVGKILFGAKTGDIKAPATANKGPAGTGAVDWLSLDRNAKYTSVGLELVYRVVTAGGGTPACTATGEVEIQYAAEYWFYE